MLENKSVPRASLPIRPHDSRIETPLLTATARATLPLFTTKNVPTRQAKGISEKSKASRLTKPPSRKYTREARPVASMNWAMLNTTRTVGLWRINPSTTRAVTPAITIGHGWGRSATEAINGMNPTEVVTRATGILNESESLTIPRIVNVAKAFQNFDGQGAGTSHAGDMSNQRLAAATIPTNR